MSDELNPSAKRAKAIQDETIALEKNRQAREQAIAEANRAREEEAAAVAAAAAAAAAKRRPRLKDTGRVRIRRASPTLAGMF